MIFKDEWIKATGKPVTEIEEISRQTIVHVWPILVALTNTIFLEMVFRNTSTRGVEGAMRWGFLLWLMVLFPTSLHHNTYQGRVLLTFIDGGKDLLCCLAAAAFVGLNNKKNFAQIK